MRASVIVPTYNRARFVGAAIDSVLAQDLRDLELLVVNDGSTDETPEVLKRFTDHRLAVISQPNRGIAEAWATGLRQARAEYTIRLDSDDRLLPHCLTRLVAAAEAAPDAAIVYGRARAIREDGTPLPQLTGAAEPFPGRTLASILYGDFVAPSAALLRRSVVEDEGGPDPELVPSEDWDLWIRLASRGRFVFVDEVVSEFRVHAGRYTSSQGPNVARVTASRFRALDKAFAAPALPADVWAVRSLSYRNAHVDVGLRWLQAGDAGRASHSFAAALRTGVNPIGTVSRIAYLTIFHRLVRSHGWATLVSDAIARRRRTRRGLPR